MDNIKIAGIVAASYLACWKTLRQQMIEDPTLDVRLLLGKLIKQDVNELAASFLADPMYQIMFEMFEAKFR